MSVTFSAALDFSVPLVYRLECADEVTREPYTGPYADVVGRFEAHQLTCPAEDCRVYGPSVLLVGDHGPEVNVSNTNAAALLELLGVAHGDLTGSLPALDFLGRILIATAVAPTDPGRPRTEDRGTGGAVFIDCGRPEGYLQERLAQLEEIARWAATHDRAVTWG